VGIKRTFYLGLMILFSACATYNSSVSKNPAESTQNKSQYPASVEKAKSLFQQGRYSEAIVQYRKLLLKSKDKSVVEMAQYQLAYTLAFYKNPKRDCQDALNEFQLFLKRYPESVRRDEAANWVYLLNQYLSKKSENERLRDDIKKLVDIDIEAEQKQNQLR